MRQRLASSVLRLCLAGIIGITSLLGPSLHSILGTHEGGQGCLGSVDRSRMPFEHGISSADQGASYHDAAHCAICSYLAQARVVGQKFEHVCATLPLGEVSSAFTFSLPAARLLPFQSRAPPVA
jgi:hypothetical protein